MTDPKERIMHAEGLSLDGYMVNLYGILGCRFSYSACKDSICIHTLFKGKLLCNFHIIYLILKK
jgi:hypothetical protein